MIKKLSKSFIPFLCLLAMVIAATYYLDVKAHDNSRTPELIRVGLSQNENLFEEDLTDSNISSELKNDSTFLLAKTYLKNKRFNKSRKLFRQLSSVYFDEAEIYRYLGVIATRKGEYQEAQEQLLIAVSLDSTNASTHSSLGILFAKTGKRSRAIDHYEESIKLAPNERKVYLNYGILLHRIGENQKSNELLDSLISRSSGKLKAKGLYFQGLNHIELNNAQLASETFNKSIDYAPTYLLPRIQLALLTDDEEAKEAKLLQILLLDENNAQAHFHLSKFYMKKKSFRLAERHADKAVQLQPSETDFIANLGEFYISQDRIDDAQQLFGNLYYGDTLNPLYFFYQGKLANRRGEFNEAAVLYGRAIEYSEDTYAEAYLNRGNINKKLGDFVTAEADYKKAISLQSNYAQAYYNLGKLFTYTGEDMKAIAYYDSTLIIQPNNEKAYYNIGKIHMKNKDWNAAEKSLKYAIAINNTYLKAESNLGIVYNRTKKYGEAIKIYDQLTQQYPNYLKAYYNLGLSYKRNKQYEKAKESFIQALQIDANHKASRKNLYAVYKQLNDSDSELLVLESYVEDFPNEIKSRYDLAQSYFDAKNFKSAANQYFKITQIDAYQEEAYEQLQFIYTEKVKDTGKLLKVEDKYLKYFPDEERIYELARNYQKKKNFEKAVSLYNRAIKLGRKDDWIYYWKGKALEELEDIKRAKRSYLIALKKDNKHKYAMYRLAKIYESEEKNESALKLYKRIVKYYPDFATNKNINQSIEKL